mmetsp:Transcript_12454/g.19041  ORF Transcript_12454/g.19041 Transcript_12454/m.19041 type:complete len:131 (-) Transcript_12454:179-571(-)
MQQVSPSTSHRPSSVTRTSSVPTKIFFTEKGYIDNPTFDLIMDDFSLYWNAIYPGLECLCFGDNLGAHRQIPVIHKALKRGVLLICYLVAHTSHWSQPLDDVLFGNFLRNGLCIFKVFFQRGSNAIGGPC